MPSGSIYTFTGVTSLSNNTTQIETSQGFVALGTYGYFLPAEVQAATADGLILQAGIVGAAVAAAAHAGPAITGSDGTVGGPGGSPLTGSVVFDASVTPKDIDSTGVADTNVLAYSAGSGKFVPAAAGGGGGVTTFNTRAGAVTLSKADVTGTGLSASDVSAAKILSPSGGDDTAQINAALAGGGTAILYQGTFTVGASGAGANGAALSMPSNSTLVLWNATLKLSNAAGCPLLMNATPTPGTTFGTDTNLSIVGIGTAVIDGNAVNNPHITGNLTQWKSCTILFVGVTGWRVQNVTIKNPSSWGFSPQNTQSGRFINIESSCDASTLNQSPIQVYGQNTDLVIDGLYGNSQDDCMALLTYTKQQTGAFVYPTAGNVYPGGSMSAITINDVVGTWGGNTLRIISGDAGSVNYVRGTNLHNLHSGSSAIQYGSTAYVTTAPSASQAQNHTFSHISCTAATPLALDQSCQGLTVAHVLVTGAWSALIANPTGYAGSWFHIKIADVWLDSSSTGQIIKMTGTGAVTGLKLIDVYAVQAQYILANVATITGLDVSRIECSLLNTSITNSTTAEAGQIDGVFVRSFTGTAKYNKALSLRMGMQMPVFATADTSPAPTAGSFAICDSTKVLDGGAASAAVYAAGGTAWTRMVSTS